MSVRSESRALRSPRGATVAVEAAPGRVTGERPFAEYLGEPFVVADSYLSDSTVEARVRLSGRLEAGLVARWWHDRAYALLVSPEELLLCRYSEVERRVVDRVKVRAGGWCDLRLEVTGNRLAARLRRGRQQYELRAADTEPLEPGLVGIAVNAADADHPAAATFLSFAAESSQTPAPAPASFAYRFAGAVLPAGHTGYKARLAARTVIPRAIGFEVARNERFARARTIGPVSPQGRFESVRTWVSGLQPGSRYYWRPVSDDGASVVRGPAASFRTPPVPGAGVRFVFASCTSGRVSSYPSFRTAAAFDPDFYLHAGDWGYPSINSLAHRADHFQARWTRLFRERNVEALLSKTPLLFWQDDHDYQADNGWAETVKPYTIDAFDEVHANPTDDYFDFRWGDAHVFCLDCRLYASDPRAPDGPRKSRLGRHQRAWLEQGLLRSDARVIVVACPMPFRNKPDADPGWHNAYTYERDELLGLLASLDATVVILSGDSHGHRLIHHFEFGELYEITASGTDFRSSIGWGQGNHDPDHTLVNITDRTGFALVDLAPEGPERRLHVSSIASADGSKMFEKSLPVV
jgi:hypothetical protein